MKKTKKKKNLKLRRSIRKTIASLIMVMAIVVAAIPVENTGIVKAGSQNFDMQDKYNAFSGVKKVTISGENDFNAKNNQIIQRIKDNSITTAFYVDIAANMTAIISDGAELSELNVSENEYYNYVVFDSQYYEEIEKKFPDKIVLKDSADSVTYSSNTGYIDAIIDAAGNKETLQISPITNAKKIKTDEFTEIKFVLPKIECSTAVGETNYYIPAGCEIELMDIFTKCPAENNILTTKLNGAVKTYNEKMDEIITIKEKIDNGMVTKSEVIKWNDFAKVYAQEYEDAATVIESKSENTGLEEAIKYIICNKAQNSSNWNLQSFQLEKKSDGMNTFYVAKWTGKSKKDEQFVDSNNYLAGGQVTIVGVKAGAFLNDEIIESISLPSTVKFIGKEAFANSSIVNVTFNKSNTGTKIESIDLGAFKGAKALKTIEIPKTVKNIGFECFNGANSLENVIFESGGTGTQKLYSYAFYNCPKLTTIKFDTTSTRSYEIGEGAFALDNAVEGEVALDFTFPNNASSISENYILAGRELLNSVTWPNSDAEYTIPDDTLEGCQMLALAEFPANAKKASYNANKLFTDVINEEFYVKGPGYLNDKIKESVPRTKTWDAAMAVTSYNADGTPKDYTPVPYMFTDSNNKQHFEIGYDKGNYIATVDVLTSNTAVLSKITANPNKSGGRYPLKIKKVGIYDIVEIGNNCFEDETAKNNIYEVDMGDSAVTTIADNAFENAAALQKVTIGSVTEKIGSGAFKNCKELENVYFNIPNGYENWGDDDSYWSDLQIADDAFNTQSKYLTFHGVINKNYRPFQIAMGENSSKLTSTGAQVCYKTDEPSNLIVIRNRKDGKATLVDYPHYLDIEDADTQLFEDVFINKIADKNTLSSDKKAIIESTLNLELPYGIESVDTKLFYKDSSGNSEDFYYVTHYYDYDNDNKIYEVNPLERKNYFGLEKDANEVYSQNGIFPSGVENNYNPLDVREDDELKGDESKGVPIGGLFSGYFSDSVAAKWTKPYNGHLYEEEHTAGNDYLTNINMKSISCLPNYAFDSCENLREVTFSESMESIGKLPFRDCKSLYQINTNGNPKYIFDNMILYEVIDSGTTRSTGNLRIVQCLEGRGNSKESYDVAKGTVVVCKKGADELLPNVTEIAKGAFSNCENITEVDLSATSITCIPKGTFSNCPELIQVTLPKSASSIDEGAFSDCGGRIKIVVPNSSCVISNKVMNSDDNTILYFAGIEEIDGNITPFGNTIRQLKDTFGKNKIETTPYGATYTVKFIDSRTKEILGMEDDVEKGEAATPPEVKDKTGYTFAYWLCLLGDKILVDDEAYSNVESDRNVIAIYDADSSSVESGKGPYTLTVSGGTGTVPKEVAATNKLSILSGKTVILKYDSGTSTNYTGWKAVGDQSKKDYYGLLENLGDGLYQFTMPDENVTVTAIDASSSGSNGSSSDGSTSNGSNSGSSSDSSNKTKYKVTVNYGTGSGEYAEGDTVSISANTPDSTSKVFSKWTTDNTSVAFASATSSSTTFKMPASAVVVTANYKTKSSADDDDDEESNSGRRPSSSTTTVTTGTNNSANTAIGTSAGTTSATGTVSQSGEDKLYITKNGVSNKDVGSAQVDGSTDNFVVKISESAEATAAVEEALRNRYGSLDGLAYFPMDISLYDASGKNKIEDTYGLNVTVTMPIPDVLVQYGGNARAAAADNGYLTELNVRFTTIDGIACMSFVPPHFSPYVIYVDTNNLVAGQTTDATPKTGDPIHPKWFLAIGMAGLSVLLFVTGDTKKKRKVKMA